MRYFIMLEKFEFTIGKRGAEFGHPFLPAFIAHHGGFTIYTVVVATGFEILPHSFQAPALGQPHLEQQNAKSLWASRKVVAI